MARDTVLVLRDTQLINVAILTLVLNGVLLLVLIILMLMHNDRNDLMGERKNLFVRNIVAWVTSILVIGMTRVMR